MAKTQITDLIIPKLFEQYAIERTAELSNFGMSGVMQSDAQFDEVCQTVGGREVDLPFFQDITPTRQLLADAATLTVNKITATKDTARIQNDAQAWSVNHLAKIVSGEDPLGAIISLVGAYWARIDEGLIISSLKGMFLNPAGTLLTSNGIQIHSESIASKTAATCLTGSTFVDACVKLGDRQESLTAVAMHSATEASLRKLDLIDFIPDSQGKVMIKTFQGRRVIVDDNLTTRAGTTDGTVYSTYLFGDGLISRGVKRLDTPLDGGFGTEGVELARVPLDSDTVLINRRHYVLHPRGVRFTSSSVAGDSPTNAELETAANWSRVFEAKNCHVVQITHNLL
jgi:hypothetical protein